MTGSASGLTSCGECLLHFLPAALNPHSFPTRRHRLWLWLVLQGALKGFE